MRPTILDAAALALLALAGCSGMQKKQGTPEPTTTPSAAATPSAVDAAHTVVVPVAASDSGNTFARKIAKLKADEKQDEQDLTALTKGTSGTVAR